MLSKSKGQILRVAACLHVLLVDFNEKEKGVPTSFKDISEEIDEKAIVAAQNYVEVCCQHIAFLAGRKTIDSEITCHVEGNNIVFCDLNTFKLHIGDYDSNEMSNAAFTLALPGGFLI